MADEEVKRDAASNSSGSDSSDDDDDFLGALAAAAVQSDEDETALPSDAPFSVEDLDVSIRVLTALTGNEELYNHPSCRDLRKLVNGLFDIAKKRLFDGGTPEQYYAKKAEKRLRQIWRARSVEYDRKHINSTRLRSERIAKLKSLTEAAPSVPLIPDGTVDTAEPAAALTITDMDSSDAAANGGAGDGLEGADDETKRQAAVFDAAAARVGGNELSTGTVRLLNHRSCYTCKKRYRDLHHFYDQLCPECAELNFLKRHQKADLSGKVALVTGGRVKIGFRICLKLLRSGASVIVTTRFPHDAARRYAAVADAEEWASRLHVYGLDLRDINGIEQFVAFVKAKYNRLDIIVNNACQTVRRPAGYFKHLLDKEREPLAALADVERNMVNGYHDFLDMRSHKTPRLHSAPSAPVSSSGEADAGSTVAAGTSAGTGAGAGAGAGAGEETAAAAVPADISGVAGITHATSDAAAAEEATALPSSSAEASQVVMLPEDRTADETLFPEGQTDVNEQQVDLRTVNSWLLRMHEVSTPELAEVFAINALAPFILNSKLKSLMAATAPGEYKFIVNVSAMEGKFYRHKSPNHPHTNMAKAALNMMTRTSAADYAESKIYMTAVDTGWINDENPLERASKIAETNNFQTPLDEIDAAARVLGPIIQPLVDLASGHPTEPPQGIFFKDYRETEW